jgi:OmpA-OmpF porin, OOP family
MAPAVLVVALAARAWAYEGDVPGSHDHPFFQRWPASFIAHFEEKDAGEYALALGPLEKGAAGDVVTKGQTVVGKITRILYRIPGTTTGAALIYYSYGAKLRLAANQMLLEAKATTTRAPAGSAWVRKVYAPLGDDVVEQLVQSSAPGQRRYLAAKAPRKAGDVYTVLLVNQHAPDEVVVQVDIIETKAP